MFKTLEESLNLYKQGIEPNTEFKYVFNCEESELTDFDLNGDVFAQLKILRDGEKEGLVEIDVTNGRAIFDEFTVDIVPAYAATTENKNEDPQKQVQFVRFTERNDNEGETWNFWLQLDGNEEALNLLKSELDGSADRWLVDAYELNMSPIPESEVDILVKHTRRGYFAYENKVTGKFEFTVPSEETAQEFHDTKAEYYYEEWYKGRLANKFVPMAVS